MTFAYRRTVRFHETDAAGVVYFANVLTLCHEAYEASLAAAGINLRQFFGQAQTAFPIVQATVDFRRPLHCGDQLVIQLSPQQTGPDSFEIAYTLEAAATSVLATALTRHVCIDAAARQRQPITPAMTAWLAKTAEV
ncbi:MAG: acyl-CoA thioesterase [Leptolyngbya sp. SIO4C1]|nr:acyl-CoA thioesterase [Leptolyngbya sp. SIO4C1]